MPTKFTYDLLRLFRNSYHETDNLTSNGSPVHRLIEQHSIDYWLWADLIAPESQRLLKNVIRVQRQEEADIFYVPFFTTISYFLLEKQECKALYRVWEHLSREGKIRSKLVAELKGVEDIVIEEVVVSDELELPFEGILDYRKIALFVSSSDAVQPGWLMKYLRGIDAKRVKEMQANLVKYSRHFLYSSPAQPLGPEDLTWRMIAGKLVNIKLHIRRSQRVVRESRSSCTCNCRVGNITRML
ncbi:hypothetical protein PR202_ga09295 [Eleusine coracana subsp. coracana]|uniref:Uncharacterized protein n=1 Tax=Eleusine coracana subsp. coracana TaxID=191504 RepID=A0AAV5C4D1_ELECO|nr:hypothetical protein PR202_ga09295 [Eleusine coracana subsp. coracana]